MELGTTLPHNSLGASLVAQTVKRLPAMRETQVRFLGCEDLLEKEMAIHSSTLAWKIPWTRNLIGYSPWGRKESDTTERLQFHFHFLYWCLSALQNLITLSCHSLPLNHETREHQPLTASANVEILQIASSSHILSKLNLLLNQDQCT